MSDVVIENVSCIKSFTLHIPDDMPGGAIVLKGTNGAGKTTTIDVINALISGKGSLSVRDRAKKGKVEGLGGEVSVGKTTRRSGEVEVAALDVSRFDLEDLVNPRDVGEKPRHARRLKALIGLAGVEANAEIFYKLVGGQEKLEAMVPPEKLKTKDLVELAAAVKKGIDEAARQAESARDHAAQHEQSKMEASQGVDINLPSDAEALQAALIEASNKHATLKAQATTYEQAKSTANVASAKLDEFTKTAPDVEAARKSFLEAVDAVEKAKTLIEQIDSKIKALQVDLEKAKASEQAFRDTAEARQQALESANSAHEAAAEWKKQIAAVEKLPNPTNEELVAAAKAEADAKAAQEMGVKVRAAAEALEKAGEFAAQKERKAKEAETLREMAKKVDDVLTEQIPAGALRIESDTFVVDNERGEGVPFDECSDGQRYAVAIPYAVNAVGEGGIICLTQRAWQDLSPANKLAVAKCAREAKVWIVTGEVADGELRQEVVSPSAAA